MATKITRDMIESFLRCKYKGHLKLAGQQGTRSDYELLQAELRDAVRQQATNKILARHPPQEAEQNLALTPAALKRGAAFLLNATLEDELVSLAFDGLQRVSGPSKLGDFYYIPVLFTEGQKIHKQPRVLLDVYGLLLSRLQGRPPAKLPLLLRRLPSPSTEQRTQSDVFGKLWPAVRHLVLGEAGEGGPAVAVVSYRKCVPGSREGG